MRKGSKTFWTLGAAVLIVVIVGAVVAATSRSTQPIAEKPTLKIGYLPITHAALPLITHAQTQGEFENFTLEMVKFSSWPEMAEAIQSGKIDGGGSILNTLAMKLASKEVPLKGVLMAVRDGSVIIVSNDIQEANDLRGTTIAIPAKLSPHNILLLQYLEDNGLSESDITTIEMAPPDMIQSLSAGTIDGYIVAEPFGVKAEELGIGRVLALSKDIEIPGSRSNECLIAIRQEFIDAHPKAVQEFVDKLVQAGIWAEEYPAEAAALLSTYLGQTPSTIEHAMIEPYGRTRYTDLFPREDEYEAFQEKMMQHELLDKRIDVKEFVDERFVEEAYEKFNLSKQEW